MEVRDILRKTKKLLKEKGWEKGSLYNGGYCLVGAMRHVCFGLAGLSPERNHVNYPCYKRALKKLGFGLESSAFIWNDRPRRNFSEVLEKFKGLV